MNEKEPAIEWFVCVAVSIEGHIRPKEGNQYTIQQLIYFYFSFGFPSASIASLSLRSLLLRIVPDNLMSDRLYVYLCRNKQETME